MESIETKSFWTKVKEEYNPKACVEICRTSNTFKQVWDVTDDDLRMDHKIINEANLFLEQRKIKGCYTTTFYLFNYPPTNDIEIHIQTRLDFIDHMINKCS
jgi:hypothetical protein